MALPYGIPCGLTASSSSKTVLESLRLEKYWPTLEENAIDTVDDILAVEAEFCSLLNIPLGHWMKIRKAAHSVVSNASPNQVQASSAPNVTSETPVPFNVPAFARDRSTSSSGLGNTDTQAASIVHAFSHGHSMPSIGDVPSVPPPVSTEPAFAQGRPTSSVGPAPNTTSAASTEPAFAQSHTTTSIGNRSAVTPATSTVPTFAQSHATSSTGLGTAATGTTSTPAASTAPAFAQGHALSSMASAPAVTPVASTVPALVQSHASSSMGLNSLGEASSSDESTVQPSKRKRSKKKHKKLKRRTRFEDDSNKENEPPSPSDNEKPAALPTDLARVLDMVMDRIDSKIDEAMKASSRSSESTAMDDINRLEDEELLAETQRKLRNLANKNGNVRTTDKFRKDQAWYQKKFGHSMENDRPVKIITNITNWIMDEIRNSSDKTNLANTFSSKLNSIMAIIEKKNLANKQETEAIKALRTSTQKFLGPRQKQEKESNKSLGWASVGTEDLLHIINTVLVVNFGQIPDSAFQSIQQASVGVNTGKRSVETCFIAIATFTLTITNGVREMSGDCGYAKGLIPSKYKFRFMESTKTHANAIVITLIWLQRRGAIKSAYDVYHFKEPLKIDQTRSESSDFLIAKLERAIKECQDELSYVLDDHANSELDEQSISTIGKKMRELSCEGDPISMYCTFEGEFQTSVLHHADYFSRSLSALAQSCGYTPSPSKRFGMTSFRSYFRRDSRNEASTAFARENHMNQHMDHKDVTALNHYDNANLYLGSTSANIFAHHVNVENVNKLMKVWSPPPAYEDPDFFNQSIPILKDPLPDCDTFLKAHGRSPVLMTCFGVGCNEKFIFEGDCIKHGRECKHKPFKCTFCDREPYKTWESFQRHWGNTCSGGRPEVKCDTCGSSHKTKEYLRKHRKRKHKVENVKSVGYSHKCPFCPNKSFKTKKSLKDHVCRYCKNNSNREPKKSA